MTSPTIAPLPAPGPWVGAERCACGATYARHRSGASFAAGAALCRSVAKAAGDDTGGFRRRSAVLWAMRVIKLDSWYMAHALCGSAAAIDADGFDWSTGREVA